MDLRILIDVLEMLRHRCGDAHLLQGGSQRLCQRQCIVIGPIRRAKARHCHRQDIFPRKPQKIKGPRGHKKCQRGVQTTGNANHRRRAVNVMKPPCQPSRLDVQDILAALQSSRRICRHKGMRIKHTRQLAFPFLHVHRNPEIPALLPYLKGGHPSPLVIHFLHIKIRVDDLGLAVGIVKNFPLRKKRAVLQHHDTAAEYKVLRRFPVSRAYIDVIRKGSCRNR